MTLSYTNYPIEITCTDALKWFCNRYLWGIVGKLSTAESFERNKFITDRIRMGLSRVTIEREFASRFDLGETQTRLAYQTANDSLIVVDPQSAAHTRAGLLEILHDQIVESQRDIGRINKEIEGVETARSRRASIENQILNSTAKGEIDRLNKELKLVPVYRSKYLLSCLDQRSKCRSLIVKFVTEIARLNGLYVEELPILRAIQIMANSELIPADTASGLLSLLGNLESQIDRTGKARAVVTDMN